MATEFNSTAFLQANYTLGPLAFFRAGEYLSTAEDAATAIYKETIINLARNPDSDLSIWCAQAVESNFLLLETSEVRQYWDSLAIKESFTRRFISDARLHSLYAAEYGKEFEANQSSHQPASKRRRAVFTVDDSLLNVDQRDGIYIKGCEKSIGYMIKQAAAAVCRSHCSPSVSDEQALSMLGFNSIIDLGSEGSRLQRNIFTADQWEDLTRQFPASTLSTDPLLYTTSAMEVINKIKKVFLKKNFTLAIYLANKYEYKLHMDTDATITFQVISHYIRIWMHCQYVFDSQQVDLSTTDYVVKIWGPIIEAVFRPSKSYFTWFGQDCVFGKFSGSPIGESDDEIYVTRKHLDAFFGDTSGSAERIKLLIFGKAILNEMVNTGVHTVYILHTAALELQVISLALVANGLYVAHTVDRIYIPTSMKKFDELPQSFIPKLLAFRDTVCGLMEKNNSIPSEGNIQGKVNENCSCTSAKGVSTPSNLWIRNVWIPSQHQN